MLSKQTEQIYKFVVEVNVISFSWISVIWTTKKCSFLQFSGVLSALIALPRGGSSYQASISQHPSLKMCYLIVLDFFHPSQVRITS